MQVNKRRSTLATMLASAAFIASPAFAQDQASADTPAAAVENDSDDIIVTAQKREENLQNVPISIQALGTRKLDQLNISNFEEYSKLLPSVSFQSLQPGVTTVYMRGVASGGDGNHSGSLPSVGVYLDEQPVTTIGGTLDVHVYDIARIESLAGPQGTLYGASSQAGTIRIITNKPDTSGFSGAIDGEVNTVDKGGVGGKLEGFVNIPLSDSAALRVVGFYERDAGYIDNVAGTRSFIIPPGTNLAPGYTGTINNNAFVKKDFNKNEVYGGRAALKIDLDDNWTVTPTVIYQEQKTNGTFASDPRVGDLKVQRFFPDSRRERFVQAALTIEGKVGNWDVTYAGAYLDRTAHSATDYTDYSEAYDQLYANYVSEDGSFSCSGIAGCFYFNDAAGNTIDPRQFVVASDHFKKMSQEFRVASPQGERFRVVAGLFYQRQSNAIHQDYQVANLAPELSVNGVPGTLWLTQQHRVDKDYAMFGEASYDILPNLTLTAGGRGYIYDNSLIGFFGFGRNPAGPPYNGAASSRTGVAGCFTTTGQTLRDNPGGTLLPATVDGSPCTNLATYASGALKPKSTGGQGATYRFNLTWKPTEDILLYGTWSRGFRPGGINRRADVQPYAADFLTNYELGAKTTLFGGLLRLNGAIYQQEWDKFQFSFLGQNSFTEIHNGPNARIRGVEMDANLSTGGLTLTAAGSYTDAKTTQLLCTFDDPTYQCGGDPANVAAPIGTRLPITPRFKANATARYTVPLGEAKAYIQGLVAHQSSASADIRVAAATSFGRIKASTTANFAVGADFGKFSLEIFAQNAFNERAELTRAQACGNCGQRTTIVYSTPRTIGVRAGAKF
ncbi:TonB-dependent receptor [Sphingomonas sp. So64.6b]|uniref:TonB-dependent receptor n=1 Tax=Sphingomonas sp. So64.6b TaxID=2997354 RepID=UPI0016028158|nr:TonB-dependent receptor [Sphingomonas sp. So64.6b]QNA86234.1 TonB-dependent receptor [Sphingomonas sp. So64.6b]